MRTQHNHKETIMGRNDAVDEENVVLCCGICCVNCGCYNDVDCCGCSGEFSPAAAMHCSCSLAPVYFGASIFVSSLDLCILPPVLIHGTSHSYSLILHVGKCGICCCNLEMCCKPATDPLCCCCCGPTCEGKGVCNIQCQLCYAIVSGKRQERVMSA